MKKHIATTRKIFSLLTGTLLVFQLFALGFRAVPKVLAVDACSGPHEITLEAGCGCEAGYHSDTLDPIVCVENETPTPTPTPSPTPTPTPTPVSCDTHYHSDGEGCVLDACINIPGSTEVPFGYYSDPNPITGGADCYVCADLGYHLTQVPAGYHVNEDQSCDPDPTPVPSNPGGPGDGLSDGRSDGRSSCPECTAPPKGQVLGATTNTLAATGTNDEITKIMIGVIAAAIIFILGRAVLRSHENS